MDTISVKMPVTIKAKLTEKLRKRILTELDEGVKRANLELQQIDIQEKRAMQENADNQQRLGVIRQQFGQERARRQQYVQEATARKEETEKLTVGAEIVQGTLERQVDVHIGDDMRELMNVEVLVEDDKIVAIRG